MGTIRLRFKMEFEIPSRLNSNDRKAIARLLQAVNYLNSFADIEDGVTADRHHLRDAVDAVETLANVAKRARATNSERP